MWRPLEGKPGAIGKPAGLDGNSSHRCRPPDPCADCAPLARRSAWIFAGKLPPKTGAGYPTRDPEFRQLAFCHVPPLRDFDDITGRRGGEPNRSRNARGVMIRTPSYSPTSMRSGSPDTTSTARPLLSEQFEVALAAHPGAPKKVADDEQGLNGRRESRAAA